METVVGIQTPLPIGNPLGQPFINPVQGFSRPYAERFAPQDENPFRHTVVLADAAAFFFSPKARWYEAVAVELRVRGEGRRFSIVDCVLYSLENKDWKEVVTGYGSVILQPVLRSRDDVPDSGRIGGKPAGPEDYSSASAYLINQLVFEGGMYSLWGRKMAVVLEQSVYDILPPLAEADEADANIAWLIYDLSDTTEGLIPKRHKIVYTSFPQSWGKIMAKWTKKESHFIKAVKEKYWETIIRCDKDGNLRD